MAEQTNNTPAEPQAQSPGIGERLGNGAIGALKNGLGIGALGAVGGVVAGAGLGYVAGEAIGSMATSDSLIDIAQQTSDGLNLGQQLNGAGFSTLSEAAPSSLFEHIATPSDWTRVVAETTAQAMQNTPPEQLAQMTEDLQRATRDLSEFANNRAAVESDLSSVQSSISKAGAIGGGIVGGIGGGAVSAVGGAAYGGVKGLLWTDKIKAEREARSIDGISKA